MDGPQTPTGDPGAGLADLFQHVVNEMKVNIPSPTHSFIPGLKPSFSANPPYRSLSFFFRIH